MSAGRQSIEAALQALEAQRPVLGDAVVDMAQQPLRAQLEGPALQTPAEPAQALRQVSILFLDVVGSTTLAQQLDPEAVSAVMDGALARGTAIVEQHGGKVLQYAGDNILAAFGANAAHEDDAERAVLCGLALLQLGRQLGEEVQAAHGHAGFNVRVGVHTGGVLLGGGVDAEGTIRGSAVNIAARMEQTAPAGALRISHETHAQVRGLFEVEPQAPLAVKGLDQPVLTWLVRAPRGDGGLRSAERGIEGLPVPMIGRDAERAALAAAIQASAGGTLQAVTLVAGAGVGKTRLLREVLAGVATGAAAPVTVQAGAAEQAPGPRVLMVRAYPGAEMRPWGLLHSLLFAHCGIHDGDSAELARSKLLAGLAPQLGAEGDTAAQRIGQLLGMDFGDVPALRGLDPRALSDLALAALLRWLQALCSSANGQPVVLVFEDLHWADEASLGALSGWFEQAASLPLVLLMSTRPVFLERRAHWCQAAPACRLLHLQPLPANGRAALAEALMRRIDNPPAALRALLVERAEGNPYYMEELLRHLLEGGAIRHDAERWQVNTERLAHMSLPTTLVGLLQARLDALPQPERRSAQRASIVGHVFWDEALAQIDPQAPSALGALQQRQWVLQRAASAFNGTAERQFDHHLLHQVTYDTLLKEDRRRGHAAVARWLAERTAGRAPEFLAVTAEHAERAGDTAQAIQGYLAAAEEAHQRFANALAVDCLRKALRLLPGDSAQRLQPLSRLRSLLDRTGDHEAVQQVLNEQRALLVLHPDPALEAWLVADQAMLHDRQGQLDKARDMAQQAVALATTVQAHDAAAFAHSELCWLAQLRGESDAAQTHLAAAGEHAAKVRDTAPLREVQVLQLAAILAGQRGQRRQAIDHLARAIERAETGGHARAQSASLQLMASQLAHLQDYGAALEQAGRAAALARAIGDRRAEDAALGQKAHALCQMGHAQQAADAAHEAIAAALATRNQQGQAGYRVTLGKALADQGEHLAAWQAFDDAWQWLNQALPGTPRALASLALRSAQDMALGQRGAARAGLQQVLDAMGEGGAGWLTTDGQELEAQHACWQVLTALGDPRAAVLGPLLAARAREQAAALAEDGRSVEAIVLGSRALRLAVQAGAGAAAAG